MGDVGRLPVLPTGIIIAPLVLKTAVFDVIIGAVTGPVNVPLTAVTPLVILVLPVISIPPALVSNFLLSL